MNFEIILLLQILENTNNALRFQCRLRCVSSSSRLLSWLDSYYFQRATSYSAFVSCKDRVFLGPRPCNQIFPLAGLLFGWVLICHNWQQTIVTSQLSNTNCHFTFITDKIERIKHFLKRLSRFFDTIRKLFYIQSYKVYKQRYRYTRKYYSLTFLNDLWAQSATQAPASGLLLTNVLTSRLVRGSRGHVEWRAWAALCADASCSSESLILPQADNIG